MVDRTSRTDRTDRTDRTSRIYKSYGSYGSYKSYQSYSPIPCHPTSILQDSRATWSETNGRQSRRATSRRKVGVDRAGRLNPQASLGNGQVEIGNRLRDGKKSLVIFDLRKDEA